MTVNQVKITEQAMSGALAGLIIKAVFVASFLKTLFIVLLAFGSVRRTVSFKIIPDQLSYNLRRGNVLSSTKLLK